MLRPHDRRPERAYSKLGAEPAARGAVERQDLPAADPSSGLTPQEKTDLFDQFDAHLRDRKPAP